MVNNSTGTPVYTYLDKGNYHPPSNRSKRGATAYKDDLWPQGIVPCSLYSDLTGITAGYILCILTVWEYVVAFEKEKILNAMRHWEEKTCIRFQLVPYASLQSGAVFFSGTRG